MKIEDKIKRSILTSDRRINEDKFIENIHDRRIKDYQQSKQFMQTFLATIFILFIGITTFRQLEFQSVYVESYAETESFSIEIDTTAYLKDMAIYLTNSDEDIFETIKFLHEIEMTELTKQKEI
jgi:hypothetical protein